MTNLADCERDVIKKLITILGKALNCGSDENGSDIAWEEATGVEKFLQILTSHNESLFTEMDIETNTIVEEVSTTFIVNSTDVMTGSSEKPMGDDKTGGLNKLRKLEIIKVAVLIAVISIIILTTCRMVLQLFIRFRPEKPPLG